MKCCVFIFLFSLIEYILTMFITNSINIINSEYTYASIKYTSFSFSHDENSPTGLNMLIKIFLPPIYMIILSGVLYEFEYNDLVKNIYLVTITYYMIKWVICIFILNRRMLINWKTEFFCFFIATALSCLVYFSFVIKTTQIFISVDELRDGIWVGIISFFFGLIIKVIYEHSRLNVENHNRRIEDYILKKYNEFEEEYDYIINTRNKTIKRLTYAIMIYENYNRPKIVRLVEYLKLFFVGNATLGIMQVTTDKFINNQESVEIGFKIIKENYMLYRKFKNEERLKKVIFNYNKSNKYVEEVMHIYCVLENKF